MQSRKISGEPVDEALFFHHFPLRACIGQVGKISDVFERNLHVEAVAADPDFYWTPRIRRNLLDGLRKKSSKVFAVTGDLRSPTRNWL
jgi:hypothetical protein